MKGIQMTAIVLIPGLLCSAEAFAPQVPALWPYGPVMIASTLEGATIAEMAARILADAPPRFALAGLSMGGYISFEIMRQAPERVLRLALLDTAASPDMPEQSAQRRALVSQARSHGFETVASAAMNSILHPARQGDLTLRSACTRMVMTVGMDGFARQSEAMIGRIDSRPGLPAISVPTLVLVGDSDVLSPPDQSREIAAAIAGAELVVVPDCGHATTLEKPEAVNRAMIDWISR
jgi:pimeloyl-ACP methyl ester carboxylesterase